MSGYARSVGQSDVMVVKTMKHTKLDRQEIEMVSTKLKRHYKIRFYLLFNKRTGGCYNASGIIRLPPITELWILCHEVAHAIDHQKYQWHNKRRHHNKQFRRIEKRVLDYCLKKNCWQQEIKRRTAIPEPRPEPTKQEQRTIKIKHKKSLLQSYEKKLRYWTKLYTNKIKKCRRSISMMEAKAVSN